MNAVRHLATELKHRLLLGCGLATSLHAKELLYQQLLAWMLERHGLPKRYHPVRSAANHSLLWLVARILDENPVARALELGAGQTTLLLSDLGARRGTQALTLESDPAWVAELRGRVSHEIREAPLVRSRLGAADVPGYDLASLSADDRFDLVIVDGPRGRPRASRSGCLDLLDRHLAEQWVVVFDDAERRGERETIDRARDLLRPRGLAGRVEVVALKRQVALFSEGFRRVGWY